MTGAIVLVDTSAMDEKVTEGLNVSDQVNVITTLLQAKGSKEIFIVLDESDYNRFSDYGYDIALALQKSLQGKWIEAAVRYFYNFPIKEEWETHAYKFFTNGVHTEVDDFAVDKNYPDRAVVLVSSEWKLSDNRPKESQERYDMLGAISKTSDLKVLVTPFSTAVRPLDMTTFMHTMMMDKIITRAAKPLEKVSDATFEKLTHKLDNELIARDYEKRAISHFLKSCPYKEYMKAMKIMAMYDVIVKTKEDHDYYKSIDTCSMISLEELEITCPDIPAYVFVTLTARYAMLRYADNGSSVTPVARDFFNNHVSESDYQ